MRKINNLIGLILILLLVSFVSATEISSDDFECNGFNCGSGWDAAWGYSGGCEITGLGGAIGNYHMRGDSACLATRNFDSSSYAELNVSFYATAQSLESGEYCHYYYYNGSSYTELLTLTNGDDDATHDFYEFDVTLYGLSSNSGIRMESPSTGADYCSIDNVIINGYGTSDASPPDILIVYPNNNEFFQDIYLDINYTVFDNILLDSCWYSNDSMSENTSLAGCANITSVVWNQGEHNVTIWANDSANNINSSSVSFSIDSINPLVVGLTENPSEPINYSTGIIYEFNATVTDANLENVLFEFNGVNYTASNSGDVYNVSFNDLSAGTYNYRWIVNDSAGNINSSESGSYIINKKSQDANLIFNESSPIIYGTYVNITCNGELWKNGVNVTSEIGESVLLGAGNYDYSCQLYEDQNYSYDDENLTFIVNKAIPNGSISGTFVITYGTVGDVSASENNSGDNDLIYNLYRNGFLVNNPDNVILGAGNYSYVYNTTGGENYSAVSNLDSFNLVINKANPSGNMQIDITPSLNVDYGTQTSSQGSETNVGDSDLVYTLFRDGQLVSNPSISTLDAGLYNYSYNTTGGINYTSGVLSKILTVNPLANAVNLSLNGETNNLTINYSQQINATANSESSVISLYRDSVDVSSENGDNIILGVGFYQYLANSSGNQNYFANQTGILMFVNVTQGFGDIDLFLNNSENNITVEKGVNVTINSTLVSGEGNIYVYINESLVYSGLSPKILVNNFSEIGFINVTAIYLETQNYTFSSKTFWVNVTEPIDREPPVINISEPKAIVYSYNESLELNFSANDQSSVDSCWYSLDSGLNNITLNSCQNTTFNVSGEGNYNLIVFANDSLDNQNSLNVNFSVDLIGINVSIQEPTGTKNSRINVPLNYTVEGENLSCWYNVKNSVGGEVLSNTTIANCSELMFNVSSDGDYVLNLFVNNSFGSFVSNSSSFSIDTSGGSSSSGGGGGSSGGSSSGGGGISSAPFSLIQVDELSKLIMNAGDSKEVNVGVKNKGVFFTEGCSIKGVGNYSSWITPSEKKGLAGGQSYNFLIVIKIPEDIVSGEYVLELEETCEGSENIFELGVEILEEKIEFNLIDAQRISDTEVNISYSINELSGINQNISLQFLLFDSDNSKVAEVKEIKYVLANSTQLGDILIPVDSSLTGELSLLVNFNSETYSGFVQENIVLGSSLTGFSVLGGVESGTIASISILFLFLIFAFFIVRKILGYKKKFKKIKKKPVKNKNAKKKIVKKNAENKKHIKKGKLRKYSNKKRKK